jgi:SAM-dependent methyltransferase
MQDVGWNAALFGGGYDWSTGGEEWSEAWGGSEAQWFGALYPRLHRYLGRSILEIAPGFGRWTKFLLPICYNYVGIDLSEKCIAACRDSFRNVQHSQFVTNDGMSLEAASDGSFDFVFSFDSLVHAELDVFTSYVPQILRKLTRTGVAFIHHSNIAALDQQGQTEGRPHARARSVSAELIAQLIPRAGGKVLVQERVNWASAAVIDCLTLFSRNDHPSNAKPVNITNGKFMAEAQLIRDTHAPWNLA